MEEKSKSGKEKKVFRENLLTLGGGNVNECPYGSLRPPSGAITTIKYKMYKINSKTFLANNFPLPKNNVLL